MYRIAILTKSEAQGELLMEQISRFCDERSLFPALEQYRDQEWFFEAARKTPLTNAVDRPAGCRRIKCGGASACALSPDTHHLVQ